MPMEGEGRFLNPQNRDDMNEVWYKKHLEFLQASMGTETVQYMAFDFCSILQLLLHQTTKFGGELNDGLNYDIFHFKCSCDFPTPSRMLKHGDPTSFPLKSINFVRKCPFFLVTTILPKIWVRFSQKLVGQQTAGSLIQWTSLKRA